MEAGTEIPGNGSAPPQFSTSGEPEGEAQRPEGAPAQPSAEDLKARQRLIIGITAIAIVAVLGLLLIVYLLIQPTTDTAKVRDIFIILMALESLVIGLSLIILVIQVASLVNLLQNEIKPILESTQRTVNHLKGTTVFLTENMVEPVMKLNESLAALRSLLGTVGLFRGK